MSDSNLIPITPVSEANIVSTTATLDPDEEKYGDAWKGAWSDSYTDGSDAGYATGDVVYKGIVLYKSGGDANEVDPEIGSTSTPPTWQVLNKINPHRCFDDYLGTYTYATDSLQYVLSVDQVNRFSFWNLFANLLKVEVLDADGEVVWTYEYDLLAAALDEYIQDLYDYFFLPDPPPQRDLIVDLPWMINTYLGEKIRITITGSGTIKLGNCQPGIGVSLGPTLFEPEAEAVDYSKEKTDTEGRTELRPGPNATMISGELRIPRGDEGVVWRHLTSVLGSWAVFDLNHPETDHDPLRTVGRITILRVIFRTRRHAVCILTIKGKI